MIKFNVDFLLERKEKTQKWLAKEAGLSKNTVGDIYKNRTKRIDMETLEKLCQTLQCQPGDILKMEDDK